MSRHKSNPHEGSDFDDFLREEGIYDEVCAAAAKRVVAAQVAAALEEMHKTVSDLARDMNTSRAAVTRILDPGNSSVTLQTLAKVASALGKLLKVELVPGAGDVRGRLSARRSKPARQPA